ncbi:MAG: transcription antitermination protein NusB [Crocinitomicaceae bacterium]|nr:transcription antitermination protein NusB [Crocinitomicaceae bacterium]MDG2440060.1 transcription antitermination protein NusB [Crocinitomicaceae bacterium]
MLNRRHLRIKVLQALYAYFQANEDDYTKAEKELFHSVERIYELYIYMLLSFTELKSIAEYRIEENKKKIRPQEEDLNPNVKFINNEVIKSLEECVELRSQSETLKVNWIGDEKQEMFRKILLNIRESETFFEFMNNEESGYEEDRSFLIALFKSEIANSSILYTFFEDESIHWMDDIDLACSMVIKTLKSLQKDEMNQILPLYKDESDEKEFIKLLFRKTIMLEEESEKLVDELTANWELDRIAKMDIILMEMAIAEFQVCINIPTKVTLNEYIEISKFYSTPKSNGFINGILDKAIARLTKEEKINKVGRGLKN